MPEWKEEIRHRLASLRLEPTREAEIVKELSQHLDDRYAESLAGGATEEEASRATIAELRESESLAQELRRVEQPANLEPVILGGGRQNMIADLWQDLRYAVRGLRKHARLSIAVIATLTLGIGISAVAFNDFNASALRPRVDKDFDSFVKVYTASTRDPRRPNPPGELTTLENYLAWRDGAKSLRQLAAYTEFYAPLGQNNPVEARALLVTSNFFSVYDLERPLMGRLLQPEDCSEARPVVVLSERIWRHRFAADPQIIGRVVHFNGQPVTVVGVAPNFAGMVNRARLWFPYTLETYLKAGDHLQKPGKDSWLLVVGRLKPGFSYRDAAAELGLIANQLDRLHPGRLTTLTVTDGSGIKDPERGNSVIWAGTLLLGALFLLVLVVCVNVATMLLARATARRQEIAVRLALGARKGRLVRMLMTETFLLATLAGLLSLYLVYHLPDPLDRWLMNPSSDGGATNRMWSIAPDWRVFVYLALLTVLAGTIAGLQPALQSLKINLSEMLKGRQSSLGRRGAWLYGLLMGAQVALSFLWLYSASQFVSNAQHNARFDPGYETRQVLWTSLSMQGRATPQRTYGDFHRALTERLSALPGVESVAYLNRSGPGNTSSRLLTAGQATEQELHGAEIKGVSPNFFETLGIPIVSGRSLRESDPPCDDRARVACPAVVSQRLARVFWGDENPLGKILRMSNGPTYGTGGPAYEVVGVARDISSLTHWRVGQVDGPTLYGVLDLNSDGRTSPFVRFAGDATPLTRAITAAVLELAPGLSIEVRTIQSIRDGVISDLWRQTQQVILISALAVGLAVIGIYGVVAFAVSQRTKEIGIRIALGAQKKNIYHAVLRSSGRPIIIGLLIGLALTVAIWSAIAQLSQNSEYTFNVRDPMNYALTAILLVGVALSAMLVPARRATRVDPMMALREE